MCSYVAMCFKKNVYAFGKSKLRHFIVYVLVSTFLALEFNIIFSDNFNTTIEWQQ